MALERTLAIIKPDAVAGNFSGKIIGLIEDQELEIIASRMLHLREDEAISLYAEHADRSFYTGLIKFMTSGPVIVLALQGENAIQSLRQIMGATIPSEAAEGTIRNLYAEHEMKAGVHENAIHSSDSTESAEREINFFFKPDEICLRTR